MLDDSRLTATDGFYPGAQRTSILARRDVRLPLGYLVVYCAVCTVLFAKIGPKYGEAVDFACMLFIFIPIVISISGGAAARAWLAYAAFAVFAFCGMASYAITARPASFILLVPAAGFLMLFGFLAPHVVRAIGITDKLNLEKELPVALVTAVGLPVLFYRLTIVFDLLKPLNLKPVDYAYYTVACLLMYVPMFGYCHGIVTRRLLALNFQLIVPVMIGAAALAMFYIPVTLGLDLSVSMLIGILICTFGLQMALGLGYYYAQSPRFIFISYVVFYLMYKSVGT